MQLRTRLLTLLVCAATALTATAQTDDQYRMEIGVGAGMVAYEGDYNGSITSGMQPAATVMLRRIFNPYMGLRLAATYGKLKGSDRGLKTYIPGTAGDTPYE